MPLKVILGLAVAAPRAASAVIFSTPPLIVVPAAVICGPGGSENVVGRVRANARPEQGQRAGADLDKRQRARAVGDGSVVGRAGVVAADGERGGPGGGDRGAGVGAGKRTDALIVSAEIERGIAEQRDAGGGGDDVRGVGKQGPLVARGGAGVRVGAAEDQGSAGAVVDNGRSTQSQADRCAAVVDDRRGDRQRARGVGIELD